MSREEREQAIADMRKLKAEYMNGRKLDSITERKCKSFDMAIKALEQKPCEDAISRQAVECKLKALVNEMETIFADIRESKVDDSVCGLCEYDCDHGLDGFANECPGFERDDCFKLKDEYRKEWESIKELPSVKQEPKTDILKQIRAEIKQTYEQEKEIDKKWAAGLIYSLKIIDKAIKEVDQ